MEVVIRAVYQMMAVVCVRVGLQDGHVQQAAGVAAAGGELWCQHSPAGIPAGLEAAAALPDLQTLLQTG